MAPHIDSITDSHIPLVSKAQFYAQCQGGDLVFCAGRDPISQAIDHFSNSIFSHVFMIWLPWSSCPEWLTLEATIEKAVVIDRFGRYMDHYNGDLVLCRRPKLTNLQIQLQLNIGFNFLDFKYDFIEEGAIALRTLPIFSQLPAIKPAKELYCSGLQQAIALGTIPFQSYGQDWDTPEQIFIDPTVETICALPRGNTPESMVLGDEHEGS